MAKLNIERIPKYVPRKSRVKAKHMNLIERRLSSLEKTYGRHELTGLEPEEGNDFHLVELRSNLPILGMGLASPLGFGPIYDEENEEREYPAEYGEQDDSCFGIPPADKRENRNILVHDIFSFPSWKGDRGLAVRSKAHDGRYVFIPDNTGDQWYGYNRTDYVINSGSGGSYWPGMAITSNKRLFSTILDDNEGSGRINRKGLYLVHVSVVAQRETSVPGTPSNFYAESQVYYSGAWVSAPGGGTAFPNSYTPYITAPPYDNASACVAWFVKVPVKYTTGQDIRIYFHSSHGKWTIKPGGLKVHIQRCPHQHFGFGQINSTGYSDSGYRINATNLRPGDLGTDPPPCHAIDTGIEDLHTQYANSIGWTNDLSEDKQP